MKYRYLSDATPTSCPGRNDRNLRQTLLLATAFFLIIAPWPDVMSIADLTAGLISD